MMGFGLLVPLLFVVALAYMFGWLPQGEGQHALSPKTKRTPSNALDILEERYARGEISRPEYLEMREDLSR